MFLSHKQPRGVISVLLVPMGVALLSKGCSTFLEVLAAVERPFWIVIDFHPLTGLRRVDGLLEELRSAVAPDHIRSTPAYCLTRTTARCPTRKGSTGSGAGAERPAGCKLVEDLQFPQCCRDRTGRRWNEKAYGNTSAGALRRSFPLVSFCSVFAVLLIWRQT